MYKMKLKHMALSLVWIALLSCEYDNYEAPSYEFKGQLVMEDGAPFLFDANRALFKFYQSGYGKEDGGTDLSVYNDGSYKQLLFDKFYKLTLVNQALPFEMPDFPSRGAGLGYDSIPYQITSNVTQNFVVRPYYKISDLDAKLSENGKNIVATFQVTKMTDTAKEAPRIKTARLYLSTGVIVDSGIACLRSVNVTDRTQTAFSVQLPLSFYRDKKYYVNNFRTYAYYRVAIELEGIPDYYLFSEIKKIEGLPVD